MTRRPRTCRSSSCSGATVASSPGTIRRIREKLAGKLLALDPALLGSLPALLTLFDVPTGDADWNALVASLRRHRTLEAVRLLFLREAQVQPLLIVAEDLHWIDGETHAILDALVESLPTSRILLLTNWQRGQPRSPSSVGTSGSRAVTVP